MQARSAEVVRSGLKWQFAPSADAELAVDPSKAQQLPTLGDMLPGVIAPRGPGCPAAERGELMSAEMVAAIDHNTRLPNYLDFLAQAPPRGSPAPKTRRSWPPPAPLLTHQRPRPQRLQWQPCR